MPSSTHNHKFLLDENVHKKLYVYLKENEYDIKLAPKGASDKQLASISKAENRIFVTNDEDFTDYSDNRIYSVVWLRIAQGEADILISTFDKLIKNFNNFAGRIVILKAERWNDFPLTKEI